MRRRVLVGSIIVLSALAGGIFPASSMAAQPTPAAEPITKRDCVDIVGSGGQAELCVEGTLNEGGFPGGTAQLRTASTVLSTVEMRMTSDGQRVGYSHEWGFRNVLASEGPYRTVTTVEVCAFGGVGVDSAEYGTICVSLP